MWAMFFSAGSPRITLSNVTAQSSVIDPTDATAQYELTSGGDIRATVTNNSVADIGDWLLPKAGMSNYEAMLTNNSGTAPSGASLATWLSLGTTRTWTVARTTIGSATSSNTLQIRQGSTVLATATIAFEATVD